MVVTLRDHASQSANVSRFSLGQIGQAIGAAGAVLLGVFGLGALAFEMFFVRPEMLRISTEGRRVVGEVILSAPSGDRPYGRRFLRRVSTIGVLDPQLGWQVVDVYGRRPVGERVPLLCATGMRRCAIEADVSAHRSMWPVTTLNIVGVAGVAIAVVWANSLRRAARRRRP
jgi:hypothetical protein